MGRRQVRTDAIDLEAITELLLAGRGELVCDRQQLLGQLAAWSTHRRRRVPTRTATIEPVARAAGPGFSGADPVLPYVLGTKIGRLVAEHLADSARLAALGPARLVRFAAGRDLHLRMRWAMRAD